MLHATHLITYGHFCLLYISNVKKKIGKKTKAFAHLLVSNCFINKYVYNTTVNRNSYLLVKSLV